MTASSGESGVKRALPWLAGLVLLLGAVALYLGDEPAASTGSASAKASAPGPTAALPSGKTGVPSTTSKVPKPRRRASRDRTRRAEIRRRIFAAFGNPIELDAGADPLTVTEAGRAPLPEPALGQIPDRLRGTLDKDYIRDLIREDFLPLAKECFESALERDPKLGGKLIVEFTVVGDEDVGGIVEEATVAEGSTIGEEEFVYCMRESMLSLSFDPPEGGGSVQVTYPFLLSSSGMPDAALGSE